MLNSNAPKPAESELPFPIVTLQSIRPSVSHPSVRLPLRQSVGVDCVLHFARDSPRSDVIPMVLTATSTNTIDAVSHFHFQGHVSKVSWDEHDVRPHSTLVASEHAHQARHAIGHGLARAQSDLAAAGDYPGDSRVESASRESTGVAVTTNVPCLSLRSGGRSALVPADVPLVRQDHQRIGRHRTRFAQLCRSPVRTRRRGHGRQRTNRRTANVFPSFVLCLVVRCLIVLFLFSVGDQSRHVY
jgi:hypothetical protein